MTDGTLKQLTQTYPDFAAAYAALGAQLVSKEEFCTVFGMVRLDACYVVVPERVELACELPFGASGLNVIGLRWVTVPIPQVPICALDHRDERRLHEFAGFSFDRGFFYCDDMDLRLPFPFGKTTSAAEAAVDAEADWGQHLRQPFAQANAEAACSVLLRGFLSETKAFRTGGSEPLHQLLLARQLNTNPRPRYQGRGLSHDGGAGNDMRVQFVQWFYEQREHTATAKSKSAAEPDEWSAELDALSLAGRSKRLAFLSKPCVKFAAHTILRGTVPVYMETELASTIGEAVMTFDSSPEDVISGTAGYFSNTFEYMERIGNYYSSSSCVTAAAVDVSFSEGQKTHSRPHSEVHIRCLNLLRQPPQHGEDTLSGHFVHAVRRFKEQQQQLGEHQQQQNGLSARRTSRRHLDLVHVDWLNVVKESGGIREAVELVWHKIIPYLSPVASSPLPFTLGSFSRDGVLEVSAVQRKYVRVNCADSVDRTNLSCFLICLQMALSMTTHLNVSFESFVADIIGTGSSDVPMSPADEPSASGGGIRQNQSEATQTNMHPSAAGSLCHPFLSSWKEVGDSRKCPPHLVRCLAEMFVQAGDVLAVSYTSAPAMHSGLVRSVAGMKQAGMNAVIATQRRFEHSFEDRKKMRALEILLGRHVLSQHLPSMPLALMIHPLPYPSWSHALVVSGSTELRSSTTADEIERSIRGKWDDDVVPLLERGAAESRNAAVGTPGAGAPPHAVIRGDVLLLTVFTALSPSSSSAAPADEVNQLTTGHERRVDAQSSHSDNDDDHPTTPTSSRGKEQHHRAVNSVASSKETTILAVVVFDEDICRVIDVAGRLRQAGGKVTLADSGHDVELGPYQYAVRVEEASPAASTVATNALKSAVTSIKGGLKNFMRSLT